MEDFLTLGTLTVLFLLALAMLLETIARHTRRIDETTYEVDGEKLTATTRKGWAFGPFKFARKSTEEIRHSEAVTRTYSAYTPPERTTDEIPRARGGDKLSMN